MGTRFFSPRFFHVLPEAFASRGCVYIPLQSYWSPSRDHGLYFIVAMSPLRGV